MNYEELNGVLINNFPELLRSEYGSNKEDYELSGGAYMFSTDLTNFLKDIITKRNKEEKDVLFIAKYFSLVRELMELSINDRHIFDLLMDSYFESWEIGDEELNMVYASAFLGMKKEEIQNYGKDYYSNLYPDIKA